ncbi:MAG: methyltransferase domain-containing protein [Caldimonas sp.]
MSAAAQARSWRDLLDKASAPYGQAGRFARHFARGKLRWDPVFRHLLVHGLIAPRARVLDLGCGRGLLASLVAAAGGEARDGRWPADWAAAPAGARVTGIDLMPGDVAHARAALGSGAVFVCGDMRSVAFPAADTVVILDALHYLELDEQDAVLARVCSALGDRGRLVLRVGDAASRSGFAASQWVDRLVCLLRGHGAQPRAGRTLAAWTARLAGLGFEVASQPMAGGTPFANVLLIGTVGPAGVAP